MAIMKRPVSARRSIKKTNKYKVKSPYQKSKAIVARPGRVLGLTKNDRGFPDRLSTKLVYADKINLSLSSGGPNYYSFRMNSLFDPDYTGTGHQPQWFDQLAAIYRNYRVKGSKITVTFGSNANSTTSGSLIGPYLVGITTSNQATLFASSFPTLLEDANGVNTVIATRDGGPCIKTLSNTFSPLRDLGLDPYDDTQGPSTSSNPNTPFYAHVWGIDETLVSTSTIFLTVSIEFQCEFFNRIEGVLS